MVVDCDFLIFGFWVIVFVDWELWCVELLRGWCNILFCGFWSGFVCSWYWGLVFVILFLGVLGCFDLVAVCFEWLYLIGVGFVLYVIGLGYVDVCDCWLLRVCDFGDLFIIWAYVECG